MEFFTALFVILNLPALIAMMVLLQRSNSLKLYERIGWSLLSLIIPIISLVLFTVKAQTVAGRRKQYQFES